MKLRLIIDKYGYIHGIFKQILLDMNIGPAEIKRISTVEFNNDQQLWEAKLASGVVLAKSYNRDKVLEQESQEIEKQLIRFYGCI